MVLTKTKKTEVFAGISPNQERIMSILEYKKIEIIPRKELLTLIKKHTKVKDTLAKALNN